MSIAMRISKYPPIGGVGLDPHDVKPGSLPPVPPAPPNPVPIPRYPWIVTICNPASALIFGKFTIQNSITEGMGDILAGHDWGMLQPHIPTPPVVSPTMPIVTMGSSHKYFLPSYAVQETPQGGALALAGASGSAVAVSTPGFMINLQDCMENFVAPSGMGFQLASVRWVGFGFSDMGAALISMAGDGLGAVVSGSLGNSMSDGLGLGDVGGALLGAALNVANTAAQNFVNAQESGGVAAAGGMAMAFMVVLGPAAIGLASGKAADAVGALGHGDIGAVDPATGEFAKGTTDATGVQYVPGETGI